MSVFRFTAVVATLLLLDSARANAQQASLGLEPGMRVQVTLPDAAAQRGSPFRASQEIRGNVTRVVSDTLYVKPAALLSTLTIPMAQVEKLHISRGVPSRTASAVQRGLVQAAGLAIGMALAYRDGSREFGVTNRGEAAALGAGVGFVGGAIIGAIAPIERWRRVRLPAQP